MALELYNSTKRIKEVPKFNYTGKIKLNPEGVYPIKDFMLPFYKPYERIGVIVRNSAVREEKIEVEVKKVIEEKLVSDEEKIDKKVEELQDEEEIEEEIEEKEDKSDEIENTIENDVVEEVSLDDEKYSIDQLNSMKLKDMKPIFEKLKIQVPSEYKREAYVKAILDAQNK